MKKIALAKDVNGFWEVYQKILQNLNYQVKIIDVFIRSEQAKLFSEHFDAFIWRTKHTPNRKFLARRLIYFMDIERKIPTFPSWKKFWHYDDKIAQYFIFKEKNIPIPETYIFFNKNEAVKFCTEAQTPIIYKSASGAGSSNVGILKTKKEMRRYIKKAFGKGIKTYFKTEIQKGYVYFQEFMKNNQGDYRIVCLGDELISGFFRHNRKDSPFASGSGEFDTSKLPVDLLNFISEVHKKMGYDIMSYDIIVNNEGQYIITEMSIIYGDLTHTVYDQALTYVKNSENQLQQQNIKENRHERFINFMLKKWGFE